MVRRFDLSAPGKHSSTERPFDDWWCQQGITNSTKIQAIRKSNVHESNVPAFHKLAVGALVLAPRRESSCSHSRATSPECRLYPARVSRCNLDGTVDLAFCAPSTTDPRRLDNGVPPGDDFIRHVSPTLLRMPDETSAVGDTPTYPDNFERRNNDDWRLRVGDLVQVVQVCSSSRRTWFISTAIVCRRTGLQALPRWMDGYYVAMRTARTQLRWKVGIWSVFHVLDFNCEERRDAWRHTAMAERLPCPPAKNIGDMLFRNALGLF